MRIAIDGRVLERYMTGIGRYILNILEEIPKYDFENEYFIFTNKPQNFVTSDFYNYQFRNLPLINSKIFTPFWLNYILPRELERNKIELLIGPNILVPTKVINGCRKVSIVHDIKPLTHPVFFPKSYRTYLKFYLPDSIKASDMIITISQTSKDSICNYFNFPESKVKIVYNTISGNFRKLDDLELKHLEEKSSLKLSEKFLLYVGVLEKRKNIKLLIQLAERLDEIDKDLKLILAGRPGFGFNEYEKKIKSLGDRVLIFNNVNDEKLLLLYNKALVFLFPSFVEGFGIPPLEAMACGRPVIASDCSALKEILKDSAILVPPDNVEQFLFELKRLLCDDKLYNHLAEKGFEILKNYSRENMIKSFLEVLKSIN